jgi:hypothetical protein
LFLYPSQQDALIAFIVTSEYLEMPKDTAFSQKQNTSILISPSGFRKKQLIVQYKNEYWILNISIARFFKINQDVFKIRLPVDNSNRIFGGCIQSPFLKFFLKNGGMKTTQTKNLCRTCSK